MLYPKIKQNIDRIDLSTIRPNREEIHNQLITYIQSKVDKGDDVNLNFICTHNSRRSHLSQIWAQTMASYFKIPNVTCYSGGTEATAMFPMTAETLRNQGFVFQTLVEGSNPVYAIKYNSSRQPIIGFSKTYHDDFNPSSNFAAVLTCSEADADCPFIPNADVRIALTFDDPKLFDNTPQQQEKYKERSLEIATELYAVFSKIKI
ncbi:arsenate-mycothiol transferase ArsC [Hanstruepera ponticola]|uniref:arsenate-mycothiol transferase ArsC n=1 Tax=Hanstruepera ponticola TaxID=2042995 RepID=UPI000CF04DCE|nr:protein-tyrosine-phosphatase [Hanstruepera ponticola]